MWYKIPLKYKFLLWPFWPLLFIFSYLYGSVAFVRRVCYRTGLCKSVQGAIPSLVVGNLIAGGSGKTPMVHFIAKHISAYKKIAILSRGYGRKSKGFFEVSEPLQTNLYGDEPCVLKTLLPHVSIFVCENRIAGIQEIQKKYPDVGLVLLDDGMQHLPLKAETYLLLDNYHMPIFSNAVLPLGLLREFKMERRIADIVAITKVPYSETDIRQMEDYYVAHQKPVFRFQYNTVLWKGDIPKKAILVSAVANNEKLVRFISEHWHCAVQQVFSYADHYVFTEMELETWISAAKKYQVPILTTLKDFVKIRELENVDTTQFVVLEESVSLLNASENDFFNILLQKLK